jgi:hypothetical protein
VVLQWFVRESHGVQSVSECDLVVGFAKIRKGAWKFPQNSEMSKVLAAVMPCVLSLPAGLLVRRQEIGWKFRRRAGAAGKLAHGFCAVGLGFALEVTFGRRCWNDAVAGIS